MIYDRRCGAMESVAQHKPARSGIRCLNFACRSRIRCLLVACFVAVLHHSGTFLALLRMVNAIVSQSILTDWGLAGGCRSVLPVYGLVVRVEPSRGRSHIIVQFETPGSGIPFSFLFIQLVSFFSRKHTNPSHAHPVTWRFHKTPRFYPLC